VELDLLVNENLSSLCDVTKIVGGANKTALLYVNSFQDKKWRYEHFLDLIWNNIVETALSSTERDALVNKPKTALTAAAKKLRLTDAAKDPGKGSEVAEILLYAIMKHHYGALSVVPKIFYKQNANDYAKGADSVHIVVDGDEFSLWFGESKFYRSITDMRLGPIIRSVGEMLNSDKIRKENSIITSLKDLDSVGISADLVAKIKGALSERQSLDKLKPLINVPIMILYQCKITQSHSAIDDAYKREIIAFHKDRAESYFLKQAERIGHLIAYYDQIRFHLILVPVPEKKVIVDRFVSFAKSTIGSSP
jgi:hypothetical protein